VTVTINLKINLGHVLADTNATVKFQGRGLQCGSYWSETILTFKVNMTLTFEPKLKRGHLQDKTNGPVKSEGRGAWVVV
jgi:hypothetical protein